MGSDSNAYKKYVKSYLASSSIRGIPRVIKAKSLYSRLAWAVVLIVLTGIGITQLADVLGEFLKYETTQDSRVGKNLTSNFPSITLCNLQPFNSEGDNGINVMDRHMEMIKNIELSYSADYFQSLYSITALFQNSKRDEVEKVSHPIGTLIRRCTIKYFNEGELKSAECDMDDSSRFPHPDYFNCYTFHPKVKHITSDPNTNQTDNSIFIRSVKMILYLDDFSFPLLPEHFDDTSAVRHGVRLVIHPHRSYPDLVNSGVEVSPGLSAIFRLSTTYHDYLPHPYGKCRPGIPPDLIASDPAADQGQLLNYLYTRDVCRRMCLQHHIIRKCSCLDPGLPVPPSIIVFEDTFRNTLSMVRRKRRSAESEADSYDEKSVRVQHFPNGENEYLKTNKSVLLPYCLKWINTEDPDESVESYLNRQRCWEETRDQLDNITGCAAYSCDHTCSSVNYDYQVTKSRWPHEGYHLGLYKNYIRNHSTIAKHFTLYEEILRVVKVNKTKAYEMLLGSKLIDRNFVELEFIRPTDKVTNIRDIPQFTISRLLSSIGGALNLWTGITLIALVEGFELICTLLLMVPGSRNSESEDEHSALVKPAGDSDKPVEKSYTLGTDNLASS